MRKTNIQTWTEGWQEAYNREEEILLKIFKVEWVDVFHIGSTSIPSIGYAKPIIDILLVVKNIEKVEDFNDNMMLIGYKPRGENGIMYRRYFTKGNSNRTHHLHIYQFGHENIKRHLDFKAYLTTHPLDAQKYGELKVKLAAQFPDNTYEYQEGKEAFIKQLIKKVEKWTSQQF
ncbi:hypothetical protein HMPREF1210_00531 [Paenisporosarcina sp. HGH0030]|uniref:GrpB family protein n=1 Tax=Paenisporosarcina sp. HGH0030 TaxID=1078085 RepID=UPI00034E84D2|nr:GrpB family protein [Paenisporosarcina sp. HGH0030]EPD53708.1 hypothetical protein HMPREF1210_00531 [Paenisporosarcina sp. HGH0030]